jgi:hypothetical protein
MRSPMEAGISRWGRWSWGWGAAAETEVAAEQLVSYTDVARRNGVSN